MLKIVQTPVQPLVQQANSYVSSFSHSLPGTGSYMSVTRYFPAPPGDVVTSNLDLDHNQSSNGDQAQDNFHPWNPRFKVSFANFI